ncbi:hypothetical protein RND71_011722 [Anisodus tanguticus]|uniref:Uncharacterized protein n=1 Tax=Anisodus tanguticus TaxID=243964 RepID=A0AAE1VQ31_9SOLA|nr:hypothetical protein RND71_011722 [Anisodus tanguticus]
MAFLCGGGFHKREKKKKKSVQLGSKKPVESSISSKALSMVKMISWRKKVEHDDENALWKRTIIKGEKCRPLELSGKICYDANGNLHGSSTLRNTTIRTGRYNSFIQPVWDWT